MSNIYFEEVSELKGLGILDRVAEVSHQTAMAQYLMEDDERIRKEWDKRHNK